MKKVLLAAVGLLALSSVASAQVTLPQVSSVNSDDLFQDIVHGQPQAGSFYASAPVLASGLTASANNDNALIDGDFGQSLFSHGTSVGTITTAVKYTANNWFAWSGTSTTLTVTQQTGAADVPSNFGASVRVAKTSTGVVQSCIAQEVESAGAYRFQGQTVEFDFHALAGAGFSSVGSNLQAYVVYGTGTDEGSVNMAFGLNAGGGGASGWTGQANAALVNVPISATWGRYTVATIIPATAKEVGVALCWTPVGTSPSNDYFEFTGAQLISNPNLTSAVTNAAGVELAINDPRARSFVRRQTATEINAQQRYIFTISESGTSGAQQVGSGNGATTTTCQLTVPFAVTQRAAPTFVAEGTALSTATWTITHVATATALASTFLVVLGANSPSSGSLTATVASGLTAGQTCTLTSANGGSRLTWTSEL